MYPIISIAVAWLANARETKPNQIEEDHWIHFFAATYLDALFPHYCDHCTLYYSNIYGLVTTEPVLLLPLPLLIVEWNDLTKSTDDGEFQPNELSDPR